jgi:hypothetical protein
MSRCLAFTKAGKPCSNYCKISQKDDGTVFTHPTCNKHTDYFSTLKVQRQWEWMIETQLFSRYEDDILPALVRKSILYILLKAVECGVVNVFMSKRIENIHKGVTETFPVLCEKIMKTM